MIKCEGQLFYNTKFKYGVGRIKGDFMEEQERVIDVINFNWNTIQQINAGRGIIIKEIKQDVMKWKPYERCQLFNNFITWFLTLEISEKNLGPWSRFFIWRLIYCMKIMQREEEYEEVYTQSRYGNSDWNTILRNSRKIYCLVNIITKANTILDQTL